MARKKKNHWMVLGTGPSAESWFAKVLPKATHTATCNAGINMLPNPDVYAVCESAAFPAYRDQYMRAKAQGTKLITIDRVYPSEQEGFEVLQVQGPKEYEVGSWEKGVYRHGLTTGSFLVQYAANHGADVIHLLGFDGYPTSAGPGQVIKTAYYQGPLFYRMVEACPEIEFIFYGRPRYDVAPGAIVKESS
jgi:hypothetical protein